MKLKRNLVRRIAALVQNNDHGEAIVIAAKSFGLTKLAERVESINRRHYWLGHLPPMLYEERQSAKAELMRFAKKTLWPADYRRFYGVF